MTYTHNASEVAARALDRIQESPETFDQDRWFESGAKDGHPSVDYGEAEAVVGDHDLVEWQSCGTVACAAGHAVAAADLGLVFDTSSQSNGRHLIQTVAERLLGLQEIQAFWLFDKNRTRLEVETAFSEIADCGHMTAIQRQTSTRRTSVPSRSVVCVISAGARIHGGGIDTSTDTGGDTSD